jgi:adenosylcobinamide kinase/adenosylcobinamide-phosphate guanylyltransferase
MTVLITGGAASGKSALAERLAVALNDGNLAYFATMQISDDECKTRVAKHRLMRAGKGFETANVMFGLGKKPDETARFILADISRLCQAARQVIIVTNEVFSDGCDYDKLTLDYISALGAINRSIAAQVDVVIESVCGIPVFHKGREAVRNYESVF